jgi:hypothetical protein
MRSSSFDEGELTTEFKRVVVGLSIIFVLSFLASFGCTIATISILLRKDAPPTLLPDRSCKLVSFLSASVKYEPHARVCYITRTAPSFIALWAAPVGSLWMLLSVLYISNDF